MVPESCMNLHGVWQIAGPHHLLHYAKSLCHKGLRHGTIHASYVGAGRKWQTPARGRRTCGEAGPTGDHRVAQVDRPDWQKPPLKHQWDRDGVQGIVNPTLP